jgi:hypothetical protein
MGFEGGTVMRMLSIPVLLGACLLGPGCSFFHNVKRNTVHEPLLAMDEKIILQRHERLGRLAWDEMVRQYGCQFSDDYRDGFIDGFVDYLTFGGCPGACGETPLIPAVPPPRYRRAKAMSPDGLRASEEWFMGFRHGSSTALASGLRQLVVVPVFDRPTFGEYSAGATSTAATGAGPTGGNTTLPPPTPATPTPPVPSDGEALPPPKEVPPADARTKPPATAPATPPPPPPGPAVPPPVPPLG